MSDRKPFFSVRRKDLEIQTFAAGGPGGQHQNKTQTGVRIVHPESGLSAESREFKSQAQNKKAAFRKLAKKLVAWLLRGLETRANARGASTEVVRTYSEAENRVVDKATGLRLSFKEMLDDPAATERMIDARREALNGEDSG